MSAVGVPVESPVEAKSLMQHGCCIHCGDCSPPTEWGCSKCGSYGISLYGVSKDAPAPSQERVSV